MKKMVTEHEAIDAANTLIDYCKNRDCVECKIMKVCMDHVRKEIFCTCDYIKEEEVSPLARAMAASIMNRRD